MIRNAWHVPGGRGWCANTANLRVLVTHADGSQTVECVDDDLGLKMPRDQAEILRRIRAQGVADAVAISSAAQAATDDASYFQSEQPRPKTFREVSQTRAAGGGSRLGESRATGKKMRGYLGHGGMFTSQISLAHSPQRPATAPLPQRRRGKSPNDVFHSALGYDMREKTPAMAAAGRPATEIAASSDASLSLGSLSVALKRRDAKSIIERVRKRLREVGVRGIAGIARRFRIVDDDNSKTLSAAEFAKSMRESGLELDDAEVSALFAAFDRDGSGTISYEEFLRTARGPLNARRTQLVKQAFDLLDADESGFVDVDDIVGKFQASKHPDVIGGKSTPNEVFQEFLDTFEVGGEQDGKVSRAEFHEYYANVSASVDDDEYFELMIRNAW